VNSISLRQPSNPVPRHSSQQATEEFAKQAMKVREHEMDQIPPLTEPTTLHPAIQRYPWKMNIVTTVFWIRERGSYRSVWDPNWTSNYGGTDNPEPSARQNYIPLAFVPRQNPFYFALPYDDVTHGQFKAEAPVVIPWFKQSYTGHGQSVRPSSLDRHSQGQSRLLCAMGRLRTVSHGPVSIRFRK
jgi:hypothetical protein